LAARPTSETKALRPASVYAINKRDQEDMCLVVGRAYGVPAIALRFFNVYGPGQSLSNPYTGVAAIFAASLLAGTPPLIFEDGRQTRDFVHVQDVAKACIRALIEPGASDVALNVGTGRGTSVAQLASMLHRELGGPAPQVVGHYRAGDVRHCFADISLIQERLGWKPSISLEHGMEELLRWLRTQPISGSRLEQAYTELRAHGLVR
jgi:dTDP-L-rhamnose 4-epimerase